MDVPKASKQLVAAFESGELSEAELDERVRRILSKRKFFELAALDVGQDGALSRELSALLPDATASNEALTFRLVRDAATLLDKGTAPFPIQSVEGTFAHIAIGTNPEVNVLNEYLDRYANFDHFTNVAPKGLCATRPLF